MINLQPVTIVFSLFSLFSLFSPLRGKTFIGALLIVLLTVVQSQAAGALKIAVVDFQSVLGLSEAGKRSKKILLASKDQKENELKSVGERLKKEREAVEKNILLNAEAKNKKRAVLLKEEQKWRSDVQVAERDLQRQQFKASESIYTEVKTVIKLIADEQKLDVVIEKNTARAVLFFRGKMQDITAQVIKRYNNISR